MGALLLALVATGVAPAAAACPGDANGDGMVSIAEIVGAVGNALDGCPAAPEPCDGDVDGDRMVRIGELVQAVGAALDGCDAPVAGGRVVSVAWLRDQLDKPLVQVIDARVGGFPGGHIPGALPLSPYQLAAAVAGVDFQVVDTETAGSVLSAAGLPRSSIAVVYGAAPEFDPARVVWALSYFGHRDVRYLDGGWDAWLQAGGPVAAGAPEPVGPSRYVVDGFAPGLRVDGDWILERLGEPPYEDPEIQIVDARSAAEYGAGHIPTAVHRPWGINLEDGHLRPRHELEALYGNLDKQRTTVVYCLAGWRASVAWLVLTQLGFEDVRVYDGSWLEWGDPEAGFPIAVPTGFADGLLASCRVANKGAPGGKDALLRARLGVVNQLGFDVTEVVPEEISFVGGDVELETSPTARGPLRDQEVAFFDWSFKLDGTTQVSVAASAHPAGGGTIALGPVACGSATD